MPLKIMINLQDSMGGTTPINKKKKLGYDMESYLEEARELYAEMKCPEGERPVFGVCRKIGGTGGKDFDSSKKTDSEKKIEDGAKAFQSDPKNNKKFTIGGVSYGWAMKGGKPVAVAWGSVAGEKKPAKPKKKDVKS